MQNILNVARTSLQVYLSDRGNLFSLVALPVIMTLFLGMAFGGVGSDRIRIDVLDADDSPQSRELIDSLQSVNPALRICPRDQDADDSCGLADVDTLDEAASIERVRGGDVSALLVIPAGYGAGIAEFAEVKLPYYSTAAVITSDPVLQSLQAVLQQVNGAVVASRVGDGLIDMLDVELNAGDTGDFAQAVYEQASTAWTNPPVTVTYTLTEADQSQDGGAGFGQSVPGMATFFVVFSVLAAGMYGLVKERIEGTLPRMAVMPVRRAEIIGGKILTYFFIGIIQFVIVFLVGILVGMDFGRDLLALLVVVVAYTLCITALSFALAPRMRNESQISALTTLLGMVMAALGGAWWPLSIAPQFMQVIGHLTPVAWAMDAFRQLFFFNGGLGDILLPVGVLLAATAVLFGIGITTFRYQ